jgi:hypothetical protein
VTSEQRHYRAKLFFVNDPARFGRIVGIVAFLGRDDPRFCTGGVYPVNGGLLAA